MDSSSWFDGGNLPGTAVLALCAAFLFTGYAVAAMSPAIPPAPSAVSGSEKAEP